MADEATTTSTPNLLDEEALVELERRIAAMEPGPFRREWEGIVAIERNRQRIRAIERATKVTLPPDNRGWTGKPAPPASTPEAKPPQPARGFTDDAPLGPPPGLRWVDQQLDAAAARDRMEREKEYRQYFLDRHHEAKLAEKEYAREQAERRSFHKGPGDADWN